jgi:hypothetical protein
MAVRIAQQLAAAADLLRPRAFLRALSRVDQIGDRTRVLEQTVEALRRRTEQLETITQLDWDMQDEIARLPTLLDPARIDAHVERAVANAKLLADPFPHIVVDRWLPQDVFDALVRALPPAVFFADQEISRQRLLVPFSFAPTYSRLVWAFVTDRIIPALRPALEQKFMGAIEDYVRSVLGDAAAASVSALDMKTSDGRIMLRRPGYVITPHRDPKWGFVTGLVYLPRRGDAEAFGTQLYRVRDDEDAPTDKPYYVDESRCELVKSVPFRANTLFAFLNSTGAHGASIPADAQPADLERYVYQFRLGPSAPSINRLIDAMPAGDRSRWSGDKAVKGRRRTDAAMG